MTKKKSEVSLTDIEKSVIKALLAKAWRNQDILALINKHRVVTVNSGRISGIKKNAKQAAATDDEVEFYCIKKESFDSKTGLNFFDDERLIRARESQRSRLWLEPQTRVPHLLRAGAEPADQTQEAVETGQTW